MSFLGDDDIRRALDLAASAADDSVPPNEDLVRARSAARARTRRRGRIGLVAASIAVVVGVTVVGAIRTTGGDHASASATGPTSATGPATGTGPATATRTVVEPVRLVVEQLDAASYTFGLTPVGWSVQASTPYGVTIVPDDGSTSDDPDDFLGKLVIVFDDNPVDGEQVTTTGRAVWLTTGSGYTTLSMRTTPGGAATP